MGFFCIFYILSFVFQKNEGKKKKKTMNQIRKENLHKNPSKALGFQIPISLLLHLKGGPSNKEIQSVTSIASIFIKNKNNGTQKNRHTIPSPHKKINNEDFWEHTNDKSKGTKNRETSPPPQWSSTKISLSPPPPQKDKRIKEGKSFKMIFHEFQWEPLTL